MARSWPAYNRWAYTNDGLNMMIEDLGDSQNVKVYRTENSRGIDYDDNENMDNGAGHSFHRESAQYFRYD